MAAPSSSNAGADLGERLVHQLDFYFGEGNLSKDRFLRQHLEATDDNSKSHQTFSLIAAASAWSLSESCDC